MSLFSQPTIGELLDARHSELVRIFGGQEYQITADGADAATVMSSRLKLEFGRDSLRDGDVGALITMLDPVEESAVVHTWAAFLEEEVPIKARNRTGHIIASTEEQLDDELKWLTKLANAIFSNSQSARDAAYFVRGYTKAYNDWASGGWDAPDLP
jgi:hypothetical protein